MSFRYLDHGADIGLEAEGQTLEEVFREAGRALFSLMADLAKIEPKDSKEFTLSGTDRQDLLYQWLSELLSVSNLEGYLYSQFPELRIKETDSDFHLEATVRGEKIDPERHNLGSEIKAITYQGLSVTRKENHWKCRYVVDV